jgi:hypothetical protein
MCVWISTTRLLEDAMMELRDTTCFGNFSFFH